MEDNIFIATTKEHADVLGSVIGALDAYDLKYRDGTVYFTISMKWYPEFDPYTDTIINVLNEIGAENYAFVRFGEEVEDTEVHGRIQNFGITVERKVSIDE